MYGGTQNSTVMIMIIQYDAVGGRRGKGGRVDTVQLDL